MSELPFGGHIKTVVKTGFAVHLHSQADPWYNYRLFSEENVLGHHQQENVAAGHYLGGLACICRWSSKWHCNPFVFLFIQVLESLSSKGVIYSLDDTLNASF